MRALLEKLALCKFRAFFEMRAEQALLGAHFSQAKKVLGRNLQGC
jgi:hypothetical protein